MNNAQEIKELIVSLLQTKNITSNKMLSDIGYNVSFITDMQRRGHVPAADKLGAIADYLDVSVDYLLGRTDKPEVNR